MKTKRKALVAKVTVPKQHLAKHNIKSIKPDFLALHHHIKKHGAEKHEEELYKEHYKHDAHKYHETFKSLHGDQKDAIKEYKGPAYTAINGYLRKGDTTNPNAKKWAGHISDSINKFKAKDNMLAIRGIAARPEWIGENAKVGAIITDKGFMSVSTRPATVADYATAKKAQDSNRQSVVLQMHVPKGTHIMPLSPEELNDKTNAHKESENEYLMHANSHWIVHSVKKHKVNGNNVTVLNVHYVPNEDKDE